jgi:hypothetical protein
VFSRRSFPKNGIEFKFGKITPRTYKVQLPAITVAEYGFLAPGATDPTS